MLDSLKLNEMAQAVFSNAREKGFHDQKRPIPHSLVLIIGEVGEALEAHRKGQKYCDIINPEPDANGIYPIKGTLEEECADVVIRILDLYASNDWQIAYDEDATPWASLTDDTIPNALLYTVCCITNCAQMATQYEPNGRFDWQMACAIKTMASVVEFCNGNLEWFMEQKMAYNKTRPRLHGKQY